MDGLIETALTYLAATVVRATVLLGLGIALSLVLRSAAAAARHQVWAGVLLSLLLLPAAAPLLPSLPLPLLVPAAIPSPIASGARVGMDGAGQAPRSWSEKAPW